MALIETKRGGRPYYIVRWNYRARTIDGKPYDERAFRDLKKAQDWDRKVSRDPTARGGRVLVAHIFDEWLEAGDWDNRTYKTNEQAVRLRIKPGIGRRHVERLTPLDGSRWVRQMITDGVSAPTANKTLRIAKAGLRWGRAEGKTTTRALEDVRGVKDRRPPEQRRQGAKAYTAREIGQVVKACELLIESTVILVAKDSGLRRSELFALCWDCVDLKRGLIHVKRALDDDGSFKEPKTHERRTVPLLADGLAALKAWKRQAPATDLVFCTIDGKPLQNVWESSHVGKLAKRRPTAKPGTRGSEPVTIVTDGIRKRSGIWVELNQLRDTYASTLIAAGASDVEITIAVGHASVETTRRHYAEWLEPSRDEIARKANATLRRLAKTSHR